MAVVNPRQELWQLYASSVDGTLQSDDVYTAYMQQWADCFRVLWLGNGVTGYIHWYLVCVREGDTPGVIDLDSGVPYSKPGQVLTHGLFIGYTGSYVSSAGEAAGSDMVEMKEGDKLVLVWQSTAVDVDCNVWFRVSHRTGV